MLWQSLAWKATHTSRNQLPYVKSSQLMVIRSIHSRSGSRRQNVTKSAFRDQPYPSNPPRQVTIAVAHPNNTSKEDVLATLTENHTVYPFWRLISVQNSLAVVILATPSFAKWLEDEAFFIPSVLRTMILPSDRVTPRLSIDVLAAVVDGLSPTIARIPSVQGQRPAEGFSFLQGHTNHILKELWELETASILDSPGKQSSLTFSNIATASPYVTLPLANTLFTNGRPSTLLVSQWKVQDGSYVKIRSKEKTNQVINVSSQNWSYHIPAIPLTPVRRVTSGLGNIVRRIDFGVDGAGPASRELEESVDAYLTFKNIPKTTIAVWALVYPPISSRAAKTGRLLVDTDSVKEIWQSSTFDNEFVGYWVRRGARFCRVLSGGGGWGVKQGLLSLDPQTTYSDTTEVRFDNHTGSLEEQQASALGNIARPGALIQFFVAESSKKISPDESKEELFTDFGSLQRSTVIGTVPSTIDDQLQLLEDVDLVEKSQISLQTGHFGAVSESGIFIDPPTYTNSMDAKTSPRYVVNTKLDLPYSYYYNELPSLARLVASDRLQLEGKDPMGVNSGGTKHRAGSGAPDMKERSVDLNP